MAARLRLKRTQHAIRSRGSSRNEVAKSAVHHPVGRVSDGARTPHGLALTRPNTACAHMRAVRMCDARPSVQMCTCPLRRLART
jgi:hypothetical protein